MIFTFLGGRHGGKISGKNQYKLSSTKWMISLAWISHLLIISYYDGALTMFFIAESTIPFLTIRDVLKVFPEWKLVFHEPSKTVAIVEPAKSVSI